MKNNILLIGTGAWGSALASLLASNDKNNVRMWGINEEEVENINQGKNPRYFKNLSLSNKINATLNLDECINDNNYIFLSIPSNALKSITKMIVKKVNNSPIFVNVVKGLDNETNQVWSISLKKIIEKCNSKLVTLSGPSFAIDVVRKKPTAIDAVSENINDAINIAEIFNHSSYFKVFPLIDEIGVQLCGALKNLLAIGTGISKENHSSINTISFILTQGIFEIRKLVSLSGGKEDTILGLSGIGDIFLTCTSNKSRNFSFGRSLFKNGFKITKNSEFKTIEGYSVFPIVEAIVKKHNLKLPVLESICEVLSQKIDPQDFVKFSISRMELFERS